MKVINYFLIISMCYSFGAFVMFLLLKLIIEVIKYMKLNVFVIDIPVIKELIILGVALGVFTGCVHMFIVYKNHKRLK